MYPKPYKHQEQIYTKFNFSSNTENCNCPFCGCETIGEHRETYIFPYKACIHFVDFVAGYKMLPTALYEEWLLSISGKER